MRRLRPLVAALAVVVLAAACSGGSDEPDIDRPGGPAADEKPGDPRERPDALTEALMVLWQARDRELADRLGTDRAMDSLFEVTPPEEPLEVLSCRPDPGLEGARTCTARGGGRTVLVTVVKQGRWWQAIATLPIR